MGILSTFGSAISSAINRAASKTASSGSSSKSTSSSSGSSGSSGGNAVYNMRDYMSSYGQSAPGYDASTGAVTIGDNTYQSGSIPGTYFDKGTGTHYVTDTAAFNKIANIDSAVNTPTRDQTIIAQPEQQFDPTTYINQLKEAQRQNRISALDKAKSSALASLDTEKATISPTYYDKRNQAAAASDVSAMNFAQYMAARGIKGAAGAMPEIYRNAGLQGQIGALDQQEASALAAIERQRSNVETGYASDVAAAEADVEAQAMQNLINQWNADRSYRLSEAQLTGSLGDTRTLAGQEFDYSKSPSNPAVQGQYLANAKLALDNTYQGIINSYAPETYKLEAQKLKQEVEAGRISPQIAQAQLDQIRAQTANYLRDANEPYKTGSGSGGLTTTQINNQASSYLTSLLSSHKRPMDAYARLKKDVENGTISAAVGSAASDLFLDLYPEDTWTTTLSSWNK